MYVGLKRNSSGLFWHDDTAYDASIPTGVMYVGLERNSSGLFWHDGTAYDASLGTVVTNEDYYTYCIWDGLIDDVTGSASYLCQGNLDNIPW